MLARKSADDFGAACVFLLEHYEDAEPINIASGEDVSIRELAELVCGILGYEGGIDGILLVGY